MLNQYFQTLKFLKIISYYTATILKPIIVDHWNGANAREDN